MVNDLQLDIRYDGLNKRGPLAVAPTTSFSVDKNMTIDTGGILFPIENKMLQCYIVTFKER